MASSPSAAATSASVNQFMPELAENNGSGFVYLRGMNQSRHRAEEEMVNLKVNVAGWSFASEYQHQLTIAQEANKENPWNNMGGFNYFDAVNINVYPGTYNVYSIFVAKMQPTDIQRYVILQVRNVEVGAEGGECSVDLNDVPYTLKFSPKLPGGEEITMSYYGTTDGNTVRTQTYTYIGIQPLPYVCSATSMDYSPQAQFMTNLPDGPVGIGQITVAMGSYGVAAMEYYSPLVNKEILTEDSRWKSSESTFQPTPLNIKCDEQDALNGTVTKNSWIYGMKFNPIENSGMIMHDFYWEKLGNKICWWKGEGESIFSLAMAPSGNNLGAINNNDWHALVLGQYLKYTDEGLMAIGHNISDRDGYSYKFENGDSSEELFFKGNPRYAVSLDGVTLANCSPVLVLNAYGPDAEGAGFSFNYVGTYGEAINIDRFIVPKSKADIYTSPCKVTVWRDNEKICEDQTLLQDIEWSPARYRAEITTDNVLVDGEIAGYNKTTVEFDSKTVAPTVTALQVRDKNDSITNHLDMQEDAFVEFYAGVYPLEPGVKWSYHTCTPAKTVKVEYSPYGKDDWVELTVKEIPENYYMPGYGVCYRADLTSTYRKSDNKWYDLRISLSSTDGNTQQQVISPAYRVENIINSGIVSVVTENGVYDVYTIDGLLVCKSVDESGIAELPAGIYIIRSGSRAKKCIVR